MQTVPEVCPNIGPVQRRRRLLLGISGIAIAIASAVTLNITDAGMVARSLVVVPVMIGTFGVFQYLARTCIALAATGTRNLDSGSERITDGAELAAIRRQALRVQVQAITAAIVITAIYLAVA